VARRGHEVQAEALEIVVRTDETGDLQLAAVAGAGVHLADMHRAAEHASHALGELTPEALERGIRRHRLGHDAALESQPQLADHAGTDRRRRRGRRFSRRSARSIVWLPVS
jgi:hypothetical protein